MQPITLHRLRVGSSLLILVSCLFGPWASHADSSVAAWGYYWYINGGPNQFVPVSRPPAVMNAVAVAAGWTHSMALRADGTVIAWGANNVRQTNVPAGLSNVVAIATGVNFCLALKADGTVAAWGHYFDRPVYLPDGLSNIVAISAGSVAHHSLALRADGTLIAWGPYGSFDELEVPPGLSNVAGFAGGGVHNLVLKTDGRVIAWGGGKVVNLSTGGDYGQSRVPAYLTNAAAIGAGYIHSLALAGEVAPFLTGPFVDRTVVHGTTTWFRAAATGSAPLSYQWRFNGADLPGATNAVFESEDVRFEDAGAYSVMVRNAVGTATSPGMTLNVLPLFITAPPRNQVSLRGGTVTFEVTATGKEPFFYQWRYNGVDLEGATNRTLVLTDVQGDQVGSYSVIVRNAAGVVESPAATFSLTQIAAWGDNTHGQIDVPPGLTNAVAVAGGGQHSLALRADGTVVAWGYNVSGQTNVPPGLSNVVSVAAGRGHNLALRLDGTVVAWGSRYASETDVPPGLSNVVAIRAGGEHSLALRTDGSAVPWGNLWVGGIPWNYDLPTLTNLMDISAGGKIDLFLRKNGTVFARGERYWGYTNVPSDLSDVVAVAAGDMHSMALRANGTLAAWGPWSAYGTTNVPVGLDNVVAVGAGSFENLVLRSDGTVLAWGAYLSNQTVLPTEVPPGLTGIVAIAQGGNHSLAVVGPPRPLTLTTEPPVADGPVFRQTGLVWHGLRVFNTTAFSFPSVRVIVQGLPTNVAVFNASGTNDVGQPYVQYNQPLAPGASVDLTIEYFAPNRVAPNVTLVGEVVQPTPPVEPSGTPQDILRSLRMADESYLLDFRTLAHRTYYVQYGSDLETWKTAFPPVNGTGSTMQWVDNGPPKTDSHPRTQTNRFYRVLLVP